MHAGLSAHATLALVLGVATAAAPQDLGPPDRLPSRHWTYDLLEELQVEGALDSVWIYSRPVTRGSVARALLRAVRQGRQDPRLYRLELEFARELERADSSLAIPHTEPLVSVRDPAGELTVAPRATVEESRSAHSAWRSDDASELGLRTALSHGPHLMLVSDISIRSYRGSREYADPLLRGSEITALSEQAYVGGGYRSASWAVGRDRSRWGLGQTGSLILSDAAPPMTVLEYELGWRSMHARALTSVLNSEAGEYMSAHRLEIHCSRQVQLAFTEAARYHSGGLDPLYLGGVIPYTVVQRLNGADSHSDSTPDRTRNNLMIAAEIAWRPRDGLQWGGTLLLDDFGSQLAPPHSSRTRLGYQFSGVWTQVGSSRPLTVRAEFTRVDNYVYSVQYGENFVHQGQPLGYPLGPDIATLDTRVSWDPSWRIRSWVSVAYRAKGSGRLGEFLYVDPPDPRQSPPAALSGVLERSLETVVGVHWTVRDNFQLEASVGRVRAEGSNHIEGEVLEQGLGSLSVEWHW